MKTVAIIDYDMGNVASVEKAFQKIGARTLITYQKPEIEAADAIVLPGVGAFGDGMKNLVLRGLVSVLNQTVLAGKKPFLGICIGMQLLATKGFEFGEHQGLGWIEGETEKLETGGKRLPHIGWDDVVWQDSEPLFTGVSDHNFYFDHSFALKPTDPSVTIAHCDYGGQFAAAVRKDNIIATQFHPEKSQQSGLQFLSNFLALCPVIQHPAMELVG